MIDLNALDIRTASPAVWREIDGLREKLRRFDELEAVVQCRRTEGNFDLGWHTIAAFDSKAVAIRYAGECRADRPPCFEYRVISPCAPSGPHHTVCGELEDMA